MTNFTFISRYNTTELRKIFNKLLIAYRPAYHMREHANCVISDVSWHCLKACEKHVTRHCHCTKTCDKALSLYQNMWQGTVTIPKHVTRHCHCTKTCDKALSPYQNMWQGTVTVPKHVTRHCHCTKTCDKAMSLYQNAISLYHPQFIEDRIKTHWYRLANNTVHPAICAKYFY
jgi:uncharacterized protein YmfQ (DUF2313 family)